MKIGERIKERRLQLGMRQDKFADMLNVSKSTVSLWEAGINNPSTKRLELIATTLGCSVDYLTDNVNNNSLTDKIILAMERAGIGKDIEIEELEKAFKIYKIMKEK